MDNIKEQIELIKLTCRLRNEVIVGRFEKGEGMKSIADDYGLTRQRVYQIIKAAHKRAARKAAQD